LIDHLGVFKQLESYEGDGVQGDESFTTEDEGTDSALVNLGISTIVGNVVTVFGTPGWTAGALRGMAVVFRDRSTGIKTQHLLSTNGTGTLTVVGTPSSALAARDGWYLGAIDAIARYAETDLESPNDKIIQQINVELADLTGDLYL
jgi:hypothetical protein